MPRLSFKVQGAPKTTRWTLAKKSPPLRSERDEEKKEVEEGIKMQADGFHFHAEPQPPPRYQSFDGSQYSSPPLDRASSASWNSPPLGTVNGGALRSHAYSPSEDDRIHPSAISLDTNFRPPPPDQDVVGQHLLYETAMIDSQSFESLDDIADVDALKKEHARLTSRIEAADRKLALERKVKDAAQNIQRLHSFSRPFRPDTPQSTHNPRKSSSSSMSIRGHTNDLSPANVQAIHQVENEFTTSIQKVDELNDTIKGLLDRRQYVERKILRHTAAVLAVQSAQNRNISGKALSSAWMANGHFKEPDEDQDAALHPPNEFDGVRDILHGMPAGANDKFRKVGSMQKLQEQHEVQMSSVQDRLEQLNKHMRHVLEDVSRTCGERLEPEADFHDQTEESHARIDHRLNRVEDNLRMLERENESLKQHYRNVEESASTVRNAVEQQLEGLNRKFHNTLLLTVDMQAMQSLRKPPQATGHGYQQQLRYLEDSLHNMEQVFQQRNNELEDARKISEGASRAMEESQAKSAAQAQKTMEYETILSGLWEILQSDPGVSQRPSFLRRGSEGDGALSPPHTPLQEDFSLQAFSTRVQHLFNRAQSGKEQQEILKRQIQQQRELNGKSDAEKDRQFAELQQKHANLAASHDTAQEELTHVMVQHAQAESEASQSRLELINVTNELDALKRTVDAQQQKRDDLAEQLQSHHSHAAVLQEQVEQLETRVSELTEDARIQIAGAEAKEQETTQKHNELTEQLQSANAAREAIEQKYVGTRNDIENLESEVVRLTTELTIARAELDSAYGSRAERAREAQAAEVEALTKDLETLRTEHHSTLSQLNDIRPRAERAERAEELEKELREMTNDFQDLTRESLDLEKERGQLEELIDGLRDRCDALEAQLSEEKVRWLGVKNSSPAAAGEAKENTSLAVMRQEFKKMMRETRAEGVRLLRAEQEQRRQLEAEVRRLRQSNGPLAQRANGTGGSHLAAPSSS